MRWVEVSAGADEVGSELQRAQRPGEEGDDGEQGERREGAEDQREEELDGHPTGGSLRGTAAVERNLALVPRAQHAQTSLASGDSLEVVQLVGGG